MGVEMVRTADCTMEQNMSRTASIVVDSGTHAGNHVPVNDFRSILMSFCPYKLMAPRNNPRVEVGGISSGIVTRPRSCRYIRQADSQTAICMMAGM